MTQQRWCDWWRWKRTLELVGAIDCLCILAVIVVMTVPALAAMNIPITEGVTITLGDLPSWIISLTAVGNLWFIWSLHRKTEMIHKETNSMRSALEIAATARGKLEGREAAIADAITAKVAAKETIRTDAVADAKTAAEVKAIEVLPLEQPKIT